MKRIAIRNKTEGRIALNKLGIILIPASANKYTFMDIGDNGVTDNELIELHQADLIEIVDADKLPKPNPVQPTTPVAQPVKKIEVPAFSVEDSLKELPPIPPETVEVEPMTLCHQAWQLLLKLDGGSWDSQSSEWQASAEQWRDEYHLAAIQNPESITQGHDNSEVHIMTPEGVKKGKMKYSIAGEAEQSKAKSPKPPKLLDLNKY